MVIGNSRACRTVLLQHLQPEWVKHIHGEFRLKGLDCIPKAEQRKEKEEINCIYTFSVNPKIIPFGCIFQLAK